MKHCFRTSNLTFLLLSTLAKLFSPFVLTSDWLSKANVRLKTSFGTLILETLLTFSIPVLNYCLDPSQFPNILTFSLFNLLISRIMNKVSYQINRVLIGLLQIAIIHFLTFYHAFLLHNTEFLTWLIWANKGFKRF